MGRKKSSIVLTIILAALALTFVITLTVYKPVHIQLASFALIAGLLIHGIYTAIFIPKAIFERGIATGTGLLPWGKIESYRWEEKWLKGRQFLNLKIRVKTILLMREWVLAVHNDQRTEVDSLFSDMLKNKGRANDR